MVVPYGAEYPEYLDEDGDWMTAFPRDKTPYEILQETQERMRQHERTQAILNRRDARLRRQTQNTNSNPRFLTEYRYVVQNFIQYSNRPQGEWETLFETSNLQSANIIFDSSERRVRMIDRVVDGTSLPFIVIREAN